MTPGIAALVFGRLLRRHPPPESPDGPPERIVPAGTPERAAENLVPEGLAGLEVLRFSRPSAVIVHIQHPGPLDRDLCRQMSELIPGLPIVVLSASAEVAEKVLLLETGADDYVTIPFSSRELVARLHAVIRRASQDDVDKVYLHQAGRL